MELHSGYGLRDADYEFLRKVMSDREIRLLGEMLSMEREGAANQLAPVPPGVSKEKFEALRGAIFDPRVQSEQLPFWLRENPHYDAWLRKQEMKR